MSNSTTMLATLGAGRALHKKRTSKPWLEILEDRTLPALQIASFVAPEFQGNTGDSASIGPSISADGQWLAFLSRASNLVPGGSPGDFAYLRNLSTGNKQLVSIGSSGQAVTVREAHLSANGRFLAFSSNDSNVTAEEDTNGNPDVFVRDLILGTTVLVSVNQVGLAAGNGFSQNITISPDGRYVMFQSTADDLAPGTVNSAYFIRDLQTGTTRQLFNHTFFDTSHAEFSADSRYLVFDAPGPAVAADTNNVSDVYRYDTQTQAMELVSHAHASTNGGNAASRRASISGDGRFIAFTSEATNLFADQGGRQAGVVVRDMTNDSLTLVSIDTAGNFASGMRFDYLPRISADGRFVTFNADAWFFIDYLTPISSPGDEVYQRDLQLGITQLVSVNTDGTGDSNNASQLDGVSADGRHVVFRSLASNLVADDSNGRYDLFMRDLQTGATTLLSRRSGGPEADGQSPAGWAGFGVFNDPVAVSQDGSRIAFTSEAGNLVEGDRNGVADLFLYRSSLQDLEGVSVRHPTVPRQSAAGQVQYGMSSSADGRYIVYSTYSNRMVPGDGLGYDVFAYDRVTNSNIHVSQNRDGGVANDWSENGVISADGRYVAFASRARDLVAGFNPTRHHVYIRDLQTNSTIAATLKSDGGEGGTEYYASQFAFSPDGRYLAWVSTYTDIIPGFIDGNNGFYGDLYVRDLVNNTTMLVNRNRFNPNASGNGDTYDFAFSADGSRLAYLSTATDLTPNVVTPRSNVYVFDLVTQTNTLASPNFSGTDGGNQSSGYIGTSGVSLSDNGRYVFFQSEASDLVPGDTNNFADVFRYDLQTQTMTLVSVGFGGGPALNGSSQYPKPSADGRYVVFHSFAHNLVAQPETNFQLYRRDLLTNTTELVSVNTSGVGAAGGVIFDEFDVSADGTKVLFNSYSADLVPGFVPGDPFDRNVYLRDLNAGTTTLISAGLAAGRGMEGPTGPFESLLVGEPLLSRDGSHAFVATNAINLYAGDTNDDLDIYFSRTTPGASVISGTVFRDDDGDGLQGGFEPGLFGVTVYLDRDLSGSLTAGDVQTTTDIHGSYSFGGLTAGTYVVRQNLNPNQTQTFPAGGAGHTVTLPDDNSTVAGRNFGSQLARPDLLVTLTSVPALLVPGQRHAFQWQVQNLGPGQAVGSWEDAIYLSRDNVLDANDRLVGLFTHTGGLAAGASYTGMLHLDIPAVELGEWHVFVRTDRRRQLDDESNLANNLAMSAVVDVDVPTLQLGVPRGATFTFAGERHFYKVELAAGQTLRVHLDSAASDGQVRIFARPAGYGLLTPWQASAGGQTVNAPDQLLLTHISQPGTYYLLAQADFGAASLAGYTITAEQPTGLFLDYNEPARTGNSGNFLLDIRGGNFSQNLQVSLVRGGTMITAANIALRDETHLQAWFDLTGQPVGAYDVVVSDGTTNATLPGGVMLEAARTGFKAWLTMPETIRAGMQGVMWGNYQNRGNTDFFAPALELYGEHLEFALSPDDFYVQDLKLLAIGESSAAGTLRAGESGSIPVYFRSRSGVAGERLTAKLLPLPADEPMDWAAIAADSLPTGADPTAWNAILQQVRAKAGDTTQSYNRYLARMASYLSALGIRTPDVSRLWNFAVNMASAAMPYTGTQRVVDAAIEAPGIPLALTRTYDPTILGRHKLGLFGRGWDADLTYRLQFTGTEYTLTYPGGGRRTFFGIPNGTFLSAQGDAGTLTFSSGQYRLKEADGTTLVFRADGLLDFIADPYGRQVTYGYDGLGRVVSMTHSAGPSLTLTYNSFGRIVQVADSLGRVVNYDYDATGQYLQHITTPEGTTTFAYATGVGPLLNHAITSVTGPDGVTYDFTYDAQGRVIETKRNGVLVGTVSYEGFGQVTQRDALDRSSTVFYNDYGLVEFSRNALGHDQAFDYDEGGRLTRLSDGLGQVYGFQYDAAGNLSATVDPLGQRQEYRYSSQTGLLESHTDALGRTVFNRYNAAGLPSVTSYADGSFEQFSRDGLGRVQEYRNRSGSLVQFAYDSFDRVVLKSGSDGTEHSYTYDGRGNLATSADASGTTVYQYDGLDRLIRVDHPNGRFLAFTHDALGRRTESVDQDGFTVRYTYDSLGRLQEQRDGADQRIVQYTYDALDRLVRKDLGHGGFSTYEYDAIGQLTSLVHHAPGGAVSSRFVYAYDAAGRIISQVSLDGTTQYEYDAIGQLTRVLLPDGRDIRYQYDAAGNRLRTIDSLLGTTDFVADVMNQIVQAGTTTYLYDLNGQRTSSSNGSQVVHYTWNVDGKLTGVNGPGEVFTYEYDALGQLAAATRNGTRTEYLLDPNGLGDVVGEYQGGNRVNYVHGGELISRVEASTSHWFQSDLAGNVVGLADVSGNLVNQYRYLPFGETTTLAAGIANPFTFVGSFGVMQEAGNRYHMRARQYDAGLGQFLSNDPLAAEGGDPNYRRYAFNNPVNTIDPSGLKCPDSVQKEYDKLARQLEQLNRLQQRLKMIQQYDQTGSNGKGQGNPYLNATSTPQGGYLATNPLGTGYRAEGPFPASDYPELGTKFRQVERGAKPGATAFGGALYRDIKAKQQRLKELADQLYNDCEKKKPPQTFCKAPGGGRQAPHLLQEPAGKDADCGCASSAPGSRSQFPAPPLDDDLEFDPEPPPHWEEWDRTDDDWDSDSYCSCDSSCPETADSESVEIVRASDPNEIVGPAGVGAEGWIQPVPNQPWHYTIHFENDPDLATAPAQEVVIVHRLDGDLDWTTLNFVGFGFGNLAFAVPQGVFDYDTQVFSVNQDGTPVRVDLNLSLDFTTGEIRWTFRSVDPRTGETPMGVFDGFLPVEDGSGRGQGWVSYNILPKGSLPTGTVVDQQASIFFDFNEAVITNTHRNTIDRDRPTSSVNPLPAVSTNPTFLVQWGGSDTGAGIAGYDIYVAEDGGPFTLWLNNTTATSASFAGQDGKRYDFYSVARDRAGWNETAAGVSQAFTSVAVQTLPRIEKVEIGNPPGFTLMIRQIVITFSDLLTVDAGALALHRLSGRRYVTFAGVQQSQTVVDGKTVVTLTFAGRGFPGSSLTDGFYRLQVFGQRIRNAAGELLDGDGNGTAGGNYLTTFRRLFGDVDGNGRVDALDLNAWRQTSAGNPDYAHLLTALDYDANGLLNNVDWNQFRRRLRLPAQAR